MNPSVLHSDPVDSQLPPLLVDVAKLRILEKSDEASNRNALELFKIPDSKPSSSDLIDWTAIDIDSGIGVLAIIFGILNFLLIAAVGYLFLRIRALQHSIAAASLPAVTEAITEATQLTMPPPLVPSTFPPPAILPQINLTLILTCIVAFLCYIINRRYKLCFRCHSWFSNHVLILSHA